MLDRPWTIPALVFAAATTLALSTGCASRSDRVLPRNALVARAASGLEPLPTERGLQVVQYVKEQVGRRYCWGGTGPACFDCSGLASTAWRQAGVHIPRTSDSIAAALPEVRIQDVRAGDILWWPGHVGIYVGGGWLIDALDSRHGVIARPAADPYRVFRPAAEFTAQPRAVFPAWGVVTPSVPKTSQVPWHELRPGAGYADVSSSASR